MAEERTRAAMLALVREWETSGETRRVFVARHGLTLPRFDYWRQQLRRETARVLSASLRDLNRLRLLLSALRYVEEG